MNNLELAIIRLHRKIRQRNYTQKEMAGLFVNYLYMEFSIKRILKAQTFIVDTVDDVLIVKASLKSHYYSVVDEIIQSLNSMEWKDFYALQLKSSFVDPDEQKYKNYCQATQGVVSVSAFLKKETQHTS